MTAPKLSAKDWRLIRESLHRSAEFFDREAERLAKYMLATEHDRRASADHCRALLKKLGAG